MAHDGLPHAQLDDQAGPELEIQDAADQRRGAGSIVIKCTALFRRLKLGRERRAKSEAGPPGRRRDRGVAVTTAAGLDAPQARRLRLVAFNLAGPSSFKV